jgi:hypothetical protein
MLSLQLLDHDDFGLNQSKIINVIEINNLEHDVIAKVSQPRIKFGAGLCRNMLWTLTGIAWIVGAGFYVFGRNTTAAK